MPFIEHGGKRVLFVHVPKAGGTSIETWMKGIAPLRLFAMGIPPASRCTPQHYRMQDIRALLGDGYFDHALMVVRDPYDRIESEYRMRARMAQDSFWKGLAEFSPWLEEQLGRQTREPFLLDNHLRPQWEFLGSDVEVFRLEDGLERPLARLAGWLGVAPPAEARHELRGEGARLRWDRVDRIRVESHYARDFETFDYPYRD